MDARSEIAALVAFEGRAPGSDAERRAARRLEGRLRDLEREVRVEPIQVHPSYALTHLIHVLAAIVGSVLSVSSPFAGTVVLLLAAVSTYGDLTGSFQIARRLTPARASQNVVSPEDGGRPGTLVLVAHYDAGRTGAAFGRRLTERRAGLGRIVRRQLGPFEPLFWSIVVALACAGLRLVGVHPTVVVAAQFAAIVVLIVSVPMLVDVALSGISPGANDNASGVATVLRLTERYGDDLDYFDVWVVLTGAGEGPLLGMREWLRANRQKLDKRSTAIVCIDQVGAGTVRYARKEGFVFANPFHPALLDACRQIATEDADENRYGVRGMVSRSATDAHLARAAGYPAVSVSCRNALDIAPHHHRASDVPDNVDPAALERAFGFCSELIELLDERIGPTLEGGADAFASDEN